MNQKEDFNLLKDEPLSSADLDRFGYKEIAEGITKLILKSEPPTTIGLYGQWGVGKSSICELISLDLKTNHKKEYEVFYFDTWKYERDSLRRQFLIELDEKIFSNKLNYKEELNQSLSIPYILPIKQNFWLNIQVWLSKASISLTLVVLLIVLIVVVNYANYNDELTNAFLKTVFSWTFAVLIGYELIKTMSSSIKIWEGTKEIAKTDTAEGFEFYYEKALEKLDGKKLLVIIDNLDRVEHSKAVNLLSDIKTFLASDNKKATNKTIFLIPCDSVAIHAQLKEVYKDIDPEEFLRKFFSFSVKVPRFINLELDAYILEKLKETSIPELDNSDLAFVASRGFRNSPREIIQFINSLVALYFIAKQRDVVFVLTKENIPFLAKVLIMRLKWPVLYSEIEETILRSSKSFDEIISFITNKEKEEEETIETKALKKFHYATDVKPTNEKKLDVFFTLKNIQEKSLPEWEAFVYSSEDKDITGVKDIVQKFDENQLKALVNIIYSDYLPKNNGNAQKMRNVASSLLLSIAPEKFQLLNGLLENMLKSVNERPFEFLEQTELLTFDADNLNSLSQKTREELLRMAIRSLEEIENKETEHEEVVISFDKILLFIDRNKISLNTLQKNVLSRVKRTVLGRIDPRPFFIANDKESNLEKLEKFRNLFTGSISSLSPTVPENLKQLFFLLQHPPLQVDKDALIRTLEITLETVTKFTIGSYVIGGIEETSVKQFVSQLNALSNTLETPDNLPARILMIKIFSKILNWPDLPQKAEISNRISKFLADSSIKEDDILQALDTTYIYSFTEKFGIEWLLQRSKKRYDLLKLLPDIKLTEDQISAIQNELIGNNYGDFLKMLHDVGYKIQEIYSGNQTFKVNMQDKMIASLKNFTVEEAEKSVNALIVMGMSSLVIDNLYNSLVTFPNSGGDFKEFVKKFIKLKKNQKIFNDAQTKTLLDIE